jgi:phospholipid transport system transporter-binding protein
LSRPADATDDGGRGARVNLRDDGSGRIAVLGELTFATAREARQAAVQLFEAAGSTKSFDIDCSGVTRADSAGLAVLLDWLAWGRRHTKAIRFANLPDSLIAIAKISEVDGLLSAGS